MKTNNVLLAAALFALSSFPVCAELPANAADQIEGICSAVHGEIVMGGLAAFARKNGLTRDEMSAAMVEVLERRRPIAADLIRDMASSWIGVFGGTNALPKLESMAVNPDDPHGANAMSSFYEISGCSEEFLTWAEAFLLDSGNDGSKRRAEILGFIRDCLETDPTAFERAALGRTLLVATELTDDNPVWTDDILCRCFPDYADSAERRKRLEAAIARFPVAAPPPGSTTTGTDGSHSVRTELSAALASAPGTNAAPFSIPEPSEPPALRILPDEFVLPEIPQNWRH